MTFWKWSRNASANAGADASVNWAEGMPPSAVNDSGRAMMAAVAKYRDDISGAIVTGGSATAFTLSSYQQFDSLAHMDGAMIAFTPHATNTGAATLNVDGQGAKPLRILPGQDIIGGTIILGTPYVATYFNTAGEWILRGIAGNPYSVPLAAGLDYWGQTTPNSAFAFPTGQAISRTTYAALFALVGTTYGGGDGSTTFNLPNKAGRVSAMKESAASLLTPSFFGANSASLGAIGGGETQVLVTANLPPYTPSGSVASSFSGSVTLNRTSGNWDNAKYTALCVDNLGVQSTFGVTGSVSSTFSGNAQGGTSNAFGVVQPTIICNYIMRII